MIFVGLFSLLFVDLLILVVFLVVIVLDLRCINTCSNKMFIMISFDCGMFVGMVFDGFCF